MSLFVADFFSGLDGWGAAFRDRGHRVVSFDLDPRFKPNVVVDMNNVRAVNGFDVILASPPCECFSVMTIGKNWNKDRTPKTERAKDALALAHHTFALIENAKPRWYVVENPRGMLRKVAPRPPDATVWYCRYGSASAKPTDLWTNLNGGMAFGWLACANGAPDHDAAPRGADAVTQRRRPDGRLDTRYVRDASTRGFGSAFARAESAAQIRARLGLSPSKGGTNHDMDRSAQRALIPYRLSLAVCLASERDGALPSMDEVIEVSLPPRTKKGAA